LIDPTDRSHPMVLVLVSRLASSRGTVVKNVMCELISAKRDSQRFRVCVEPWKCTATCRIYVYVRTTCRVYIYIYVCLYVRVHISNVRAYFGKTRLAAFPSVCSAMEMHSDLQNICIYVYDMQGIHIHIPDYIHKSTY